MSEIDLKFGTYVSEFEILGNKDSTRSVRKISRQVLKSMNDPRVQLLHALSRDKPQHLLVPEAINAEPGQHLSEFYPYSSRTLEDVWHEMSELIAQGRIGEGYLLDMLRQLAQATAYIHQSEFVHTDVRPSNILVEGSANEPEVTLFDYSGVRRPYRPSGEFSSWNEEHPDDPYVDFRFDVYSIGKILHKLTHDLDGKIKTGLSEAHPLFEVISIALKPYEGRPKDALELTLLIDDIM